MKKWVRFFGPALVLVFLLVYSLHSPASAKVISSEETIVIAEDEVIDDDLFAAAETIRVNGTINGDLYVAGGLVTVDGVVNGDILAAGGVVNISGEVGDDVRVAGGQIRIRNAKIGDSVSVMGGSVDLDEDTMVGGALAFGSGLLISRADVARGVVGGAGSLVLDGPVGGNMRVGAEELTLGPNTKVKGDFIYASEKRAAVDEDAVISGKVRRILPKTSKVQQRLKTFSGFGRRLELAFKVWAYFAALLVGFVTLYMFRKPAGQIATNISKQPFRTFGLGLLLFIVTGPALVLLAITGIGLPLAAILGFVFLVELYIAKIFVAIILGESVVSALDLKKANRYVGFTLGLLIYFVLISLPILRFFAWIATLLFGLGAIFSYKWELLAKLRK